MTIESISQVERTTGKLEDSSFWVNDVELKIAPEQISIQHQSFMNDWQTMRTSGSRRVKSGHSIVSVSFAIPFAGNESINYKLRPLVAGLRAIPFCSINNKYLADELGGLSGEIASAQYKQFKPIVLALNSMTFATVPGKPDTILGQFQFMWFNYLPYTPIWAYKSGIDLENPGSVKDSMIWKAFYQPFLNQTEPVLWPHLDSSVEQTFLRYREFSIQPSGNSNALKAAQELVNIIKNNPQIAFSTLKDVLGQDTTNAENNLTKLYNKLVEQGVIKSQEANLLKNLKSGTLEKSAADVVYPLLKKLYPNIVHAQKSASNVVNENKAHINSAAAELATRWKRASQQLNQNIISSWEEIKEFSKEIVFDDKSGAKISVGGYKVFGRKRNFQVSTIGSGGIGAGFVLQGLSITFAPSLAIIPMTGHNHPTVQFMGGYDVELSLSINAQNDNMKELSTVYHRWEDINLRYRQIPQSFRNIIIENDFVNLFGVKEWLPKSLETSTIPEQPSRSQATLSFVDAGIDSTTQFDDPEVLQQEFTQSDPQLRREAYNIIAKALRDKNDGTGRVEVNTNADLRHRQFLKIVLEAALAYNDLVYPLVKSIKKNWIGTIGTTGYQAYLDIMNLTQSDIGFIPGLERIQKAIKNEGPIAPKAQLSTVKRGLEAFTKQAPWAQTNITKQKDSNKSQAFRDYLSTSEGQLPASQGSLAAQYKHFGASTDLALPTDSPQDRLTKTYQRLYGLGFQAYLTRMRDILDRVIANPEAYQFATIKAAKAKSGVGQGKLAYPDFKPQLKSVASMLSGSDPGGSIIDYDPDIYLWYPLLNGSLSNPLTGVIVDEMTVSKARQHSMNIFDNVQGDLGKFFKEVYIERLGRAGEPPVDTLKKLSNGVMATPFADRANYKNSLLNASEAGENKRISVSVVPDPGKIPTNFYGQSKIDLTANDSIEHSTDLNDLWGGVQTETGNADQNREPSQAGKSVVPPSFGSVVVACKADARWGVLPITYEWPMSPSEQAPIGGLVCPLESYTYRADGGCLGLRDIGQSKDLVAWGYRSKAAVKHWATSQDILQKGGYSNPNKAPSDSRIRGQTYYGKPVKKWTLAQYNDWKRRTKGKMGYVHQGIDSFAAIGTRVYAIADSVVDFVAHKPYAGAGYYVILQHPGKPNGIAYSRYLHLQAIAPQLKRGKRITAGTVIGVVGRSGQRSMTPHLHFEVWSGKPGGYGPNLNKNAHVLSPLKVNIPWRKGKHTSRTLSPKAKERLSTLAQTTPKTDITSTVTSPLAESVKEFEKKLLKGQAQRVVRAMPTFKLYFIEDDSGQRKRLAFDDFFSYNAVQSIKVVKSRKIPADVAIVELTNISGTLSNRKFRHQKDGDKARDLKGAVVTETKALDSPMNAGTLDENPIASLMLQTGIDIHIKAGYSSDPKLLDPLFTGKIQSVIFSETDDLVTIIAQSHATELVQDIKGIEKPKKKTTDGLWSKMGFGDNATTGRIFEEMLAQPEVVHFGRWEHGDTTFNRELLTNKFQFIAKPQDDNIFAPPPDAELNAFGDGSFWKELAYFIYRTTIWEIFKEMEMRHPNYIGSPVPYSDQKGERMTYFFGLPNQMYFSRAPKAEEQSAQQKLNDEANNIKDTIEKESVKYAQAVDNLKKSMVGAASLSKVNPKLANLQKILFVGIDPSKILGAYDKAYATIYKLSPAGRQINKTVNKIYRQKRLQLAREAGYIKPFRNYHLFTSQSHIVANNIRADAKDVANTIAVVYPKAKVTTSLVSGTTITQDKETYILKLDNALPAEEIRTQIGEFPNVINEEMAERYALSLLVQNLKDIYKGDLVVIGDATIKPYDIAYILDEYSDLTGAVEVEQVIHSMNRDTGYLCEITPDMVVVAAEWSLLGCTEALSIVAEGVLKQVWGKDVVNTNKAVFSPWTWMMSQAGNLVGGLTAKKLVNFTQTGLPVVMSPLIHNGREFTGGIPTRKIPTSLWNTIFGEWHSEADKSSGAWLEDWSEDIGRSINKLTGGYSVGSVLDGWTSNTIDNS